jgi:transposase
LEKHRFKWPQSRKEVMEIRCGELGFLLEGLDLGSVQPHEALKYMTVM